MTSIKSFTFLLGFAGVTGLPALAQSADVDVSATIVAPVSPLAVSGENNLSFGTVHRPTGALQGGFCEYRLGTRSPEEVPLIASIHLLPDGTRDYDRQSGCRSEQDAQFARFAIACSAETPVFYSVSVTPTSSEASLRAEDTFPILYWDGAGDPTVYAKPSGTAGLEDFEYACSSTGQTEIIVGGTVRISEDAVPADGQSIGTITVAASYN